MERVEDSELDDRIGSSSGGFFISGESHLPVRVAVKAQRPYLLSGVPNSQKILFEVFACLDHSERVPIDLAVVLDRSASMEGEKMKCAKDAILTIIERLDQRDCLHFVTYDDRGEVIFQDGNLDNKDQLIMKVRNISAKGGTSLSSGIDLGYRLLKKNKKNIVQRIFLFSDGKANCGITVSAGILKIVDNIVSDGVTISTFGLGDDFDEDLMRSISERGSGNYYFIESPSQIKTCVENAFNILVGLIGTNACFKIHNEKFSTLCEIYGTDNPNNGYVFGDINSSGKKNILIEMQITPGNYSSSCKVLNWELSYRTTFSPVTIQTLRGNLELECTDDPQLLNTEDYEVTIAGKLKDFGKQDKECKLLLDQNKIPELIMLLKSMLGEMNEFVDKDHTGRIQKLIEIAQNTLSSLSEERHVSPHRNTPSYSQVMIYPFPVHINPGGLSTISENPYQPTAAQTVPTRQKPKLTFKAVRKYFDSGDYLCKADNSSNWESWDFSNN